MFPSPIGVLYISIIHNRLTYTNCIEFPSPIGVLYISMKYASYYKSASRYLFPSPIGVLYISILLMNMMNYMMTRFRPLLGFFIFQSALYEKYVFYKNVSVPYWGSLYFNPVLRSPYNYRAAKPDCGAKPNPAFTI